LRGPPPYRRKMRVIAAHFLLACEFLICAFDGASAVLPGSWISAARSTPLGRRSLRLRGGVAGDREDLLKAFESLREDIGQSIRRRPATIAWTTSTVRNHLGPPSRPLPGFGLIELDTEYEYIPLGSLEEDVAATGRYTIVRCITRPIKDTGVACVVEDADGTARQMSIVNLLSPLGRLVDASFALPPEEALLVLDPLLKSSLSGGAARPCPARQAHRPARLTADRARRADPVHRQPLPRDRARGVSPPRDLPR